MPTLDFKGKQHVYAHHLTVPWRPLVPHPEKSVGNGAIDDNLIIHGDNLHALKALLPRFGGRVRCIYIDPPYNTGNEGWIYNDNANGPLLKQWLKDQSPVDGEDMERHDKWLCMMWPRLHLLRELLSDDGVIFVSIDDNEIHHLRMLMDEVFGEENFFVTQTRRAMHTVRNSSKDFNLNADYVVTYAKDKSWFAEHSERYIRYRTDKSDRYPKDDGDGRGPYKLDPLHARNYYEPYTFAFRNGTTWSAPPGGFPRYSRESLQQMEDEDRIDFSGTEPRAKRYLSDVQEGQPPNAILDPEIVGYNASGTRMLRDIFGTGGVFPQPKPVELIRYLVELLRDPNAIVLDSFAGSGTTAQAVLDLNKQDGGDRRFILVECEDYADSIAAERVRRVISGVPGAKNATIRGGLGGSFTYCTLGEPVTAVGMLTGETLPTYSSLAAWLMNTATGRSLGPTELRALDDHGLIGSDERRNYYLRYRPDIDWLRSNDAVLTETRAEQLGEICRQQNKDAVVFAAAKFIPQGDLTGLRITFCQLPYTIRQSETV
ncbi:MAG: site-specific DNA-methyltransferase [bacterium]|nr:site-specific DNA-methyltransferase [bacterium]